MERHDTKKAPGEAHEVLRIRLLGGFRVSVGSRTIEESGWRLRKAASLVKLLALAPGHHLHREQVMDRLWPDLSPKAAANNLHRALHVARRTLEPAASSRYLRLRDEELALCPSGRVWVDVEAFEEAAATARRAREPAAYRAALDLYAGDLLPEDRYEDWAETRRAWLREEYLALLAELAGLYEQRRELEQAVGAFRRALSVEPAREVAHVGLMRLYATSGQRGRALEQYERLSEALSREFGAEPDAASRHLHAEIAGGRFPPERPPDDRPPEEPTGIRKHNLPAQRTSFVGRERELVELKRELAMTRLLTLTGAGGSGKTRLALEAARDLVDAYPDGAWMAELASLSEPALVPHSVAGALEVHEQLGRPLTETLVETLRERDMLLVLDNCEHLIDATAHLVDTLLDSCSNLRILATSREALGVAGEVVWPVPPLSLPERSRPITLEELEGYESARLFVERALYRPTAFALTERNAGTVAEICRKLDGIPLGIELAAARVGTLAVEQISEKLEDSLRLLTGGGRTAAPRQRALRATLDWSHDLLDEPERALFERLSGFAGGWTLEVAEKIVGAGQGIGEDDVLDLTSRLVDKSLVVAEARPEGTFRYRMLEAVRQYAWEKLVASGEAREIRRRHAAWYLALAEEAEPKITTAQQGAWLERLEAEHDNLRAALSWSLEDEPETALRLVTALARFWEVRSYFSEGSAWLEAALRRSDRADADALRAKVFGEAGTFAWHRGDYERATVLHGEALALYREIGDEHGAAFALNNLGVQELEKGDYESAAPLFEEALSLSREVGDRRTIAYVHHNLGEVARHRDEYGRAKTLGAEALSLFRELDDEWCVARTLSWLGLVTAYKGDDHEAAAGFLREGLALIQRIGDWEWATYCLESFAALAGAQGDGTRAARLYGAAEALRETIGAPLPPVDRPDYDRSVAAARSRLDEAAFAAAWAEGRAMPLETAVEYALADERPAPPPASAPEESAVDEQPGLLTGREQEVALLVARGMTNRQISAELVISGRTVDNHVARILRKLDLRSRAQIAAWVVERQPLPQDPN
jgi:predicted ATPase/DNA-binding SARP family transcriptional activator/DNA-binding CsgD family transcriptional regulator